MWQARVLPRLGRLLVILLTITVSTLSLTLLISPLFAQEGGLLPGEELGDNPKERTVTVTASVPVQDPPPVPLLIEPEDEDLLNSGAITFRWKLQEHLVPYKKQELKINGETVFFDISLSDDETDEYRLRFVDGEYVLQLKPGHYLPDGDYTWRVRAIDVNNRSTASTTWIFTIDSQAPQLLVTKVEQHQTAISSHDATTVPDEAFVVSTKTPVVSGKTESNAQVQLSVLFPDGRTDTQVTVADAAGNFSFTLPALARGEVVELRFSAIDEAGNTSALSEIFVTYEPPILEFPLVPPFLLPDVPIVEIPLDLPVITLPELPVPPAIEQPVEDLRSLFEITRDFLSEMLPLLPWLSLLFFWLYLLVLYLLTGSSLRFFLLFAWQFALAWCRGWKKQTHIWKDSESQQPIPGLAFEIQRTSEQDTKLRKQAVVTSLYGEWSVQERPGWLHSLVLSNNNWKYPVEGRFSETWQGVRQLWFYGESFTWNTASTGKEWQTSGESFVLPEKLADFQFVAWSIVRRGSRTHWLRFLPRFFLALALMLAATVVLLAPSLFSLLWFVFVLWVLFRDIVWSVPELWKVHFRRKRKERGV